MAIIIISITAFVILLVFPILFSLYFLLRRDGKVLDIQQSKIKDPRYFVKSFTGLFDQKWVEYDGSGKIRLSREEKVLEADGVEEYPSICDSIVYAEKQEFRPPTGIYFEKEVYTRQNAYLFGIETIRVICSKKDIVLGSGTQVLRWVDAEGILTVHDNCDLGISASSTTKLIMGSNCRFRRLYAPIIIFGQTSEEALAEENAINVDVEAISTKRIWNIRYVNDDLVDGAGVLTGSITTPRDLTVLNRLTVKGHIRSHKTIRLGDNAVVYGNLFAEGDIYLGQNSRVYGTVFTQGELYAEDGVVIGQPGKTKSVIARGRIIFNKNCRVYGYVSSEKGGECCSDSSLGKREEGIVLVMSTNNPWKGYLPEKARSAVIGTAVLLGVIAIGILATVQLNKIQENELSLEQQKTAKAVRYGVDGKPGGGQLATEPTLVTKEYVYYEDRVLGRFHYDDGTINKSSKALRGMMTALPNKVNKYLMVAPMRISMEGAKYKEDSVAINDAITKIYDAMPPEVVTLDAAGALLPHKDEYIFFRTDEVWTALGAYYAAKEYCKNTGIDMIPIKDYREQRFENYVGTMRVLPHTQSLGEYPDYVSYYLRKGAANEQTITAYRSPNNYRTYKSPTVDLARRGYDIFVGANFSHSIIRGDANNGKTLMILGDKDGKSLAPWLTPYYEKVLLVDINFFDGGSKELTQLISKFEVTDCLVIEQAQNIGNSTINDRIRELSTKP